ncbi:hypothetical protein GCM10011376_22040 [Nocardioides flavus (ex Wang et al. 2016)]|uniref:GlsB/YeaQ/YmgE family stress response membrane protein n=1 Tax=Nocardioides flavus (ex Wang et al. 2016) TaxID=2058780 RepID=A0ABQ3HN89_9ACTN|nr:hypothetical protein [Nocardioides flavus (ex Wang et al. 2016)]GHE17594.1 hypothetical protein GCM10011376_22040 [Nocardioides flavus (ex Wang et al. 2016)]
MRVLGIFDSAWTLVFLAVTGAVLGLVVKAATSADAGWGVAAGLGALGGVVVHYVGTGLLWIYGLTTAAGAARRAARRG